MPQTFTVSFSRSPVIVLILVGIPLLVVAVFLAGITMWAKDAPDWLIIVLIIMMMAAALSGVLAAITAWGTLDAEVKMDDHGIAIRLLGRSPFYPRRSYASSWDGLENMSTNVDTQHNKRFYQVTFRRPATTVSLMPAEAADEETETPFGDALLAHVARYNDAHRAIPDTIIRSRGFYDSWWAKILTILAYAMSAAVIVTHTITPEDVDTWRVLQVTAFSAMWLAAYHANRRHRKA